MSDQFILLPAYGLKAFQSDRSAFQALTGVGHARSTQPPVPLGFGIPGLSPTISDVRVIDSIHEDGPKLIEADMGQVEAIQSTLGLRVRPLITYRVALPSPFKPDPIPAAAGSPPTIVKVVSAMTALPIPNALVTAFTDFQAHLGAEASTDANGEVRLNLGWAALQVERLFVQPPMAGFWGASASNILLPPMHLVQLMPVDMTVPDVVRHFYAPANANDGLGVRVAVVDTGIGPHADLIIDPVASRNTAKGEPFNLWQDNGTGHGTHVAGIIASRGAAPGGLPGLAPAVQLRSYRAFRADSIQTTNYNLMKAIMYAVDDGCHVVNLSVAGENRPDDTLEQALDDARDRGTLVVAAAGNGNRKPVSFPGAYAYASGLSVSALGRVGTFPAGSFEESHIDSPKGSADANNFVARFTNIGNVSLIGPGVGVVSTVPGGYGPMSGTSMACPTVTGFAARLLSADLQQNGATAILNMIADKARALRMIALVSNAARKMGFGQQYEGDGLVQ
jgi:subtilisin